jgi:hypothetical protein
MATTMNAKAAKATRRWAVILGAGGLVAGALLAACSSSSNPQPNNVYQVGSDAGDSGVDGTTPQPEAGTGADVQQQPDGGQEDGDLQDGELLPDQDAQSCTTDAGCWSCIPTTEPEFLNQCTTSQCSPFVNTQRLPDYDGSLPPLN